MLSFSLSRALAAPLFFASLGLAFAAVADEPPDYEFKPLTVPGLTDARPVPKFQFLFGTPAKWFAPIPWFYNPSGASSAFADVDTAVAAISAGAAKWSAVCAVQFAYMGTTTVAPNTRVTMNGNDQPDFVNVVGWGPLPTNVAGLTYSWYTPAGNPYPLVDSDIIYAPMFVATAAQIDRVATHEWGHAMGLKHSNLNGTVMSGTPDSIYNSLTVLQPDDIRGCRCLYGMPAGQTQGYICSLPPKVDFGSLAVGTMSAPITVTVTNGGNAPLAINGYAVTSSDYLPSGCAAGTTLTPGASCAMSLMASPVTTDSRPAHLLINTSDGQYDLPLASIGTASPPGTPVAVVEFYNATLEHYFISAAAQEISDLDNHVHPGWARTGLSFNAYTSATAGASPVCRLYIPPANGDSHFYSASPTECAQTLQKFPTFVYESPSVFYIGLPDTNTGACAGGTTPVYRVWNQRLDSNHRYTTSRSVRDQMVAMGYLAEGYGPDSVIMCAAP